MGTRNTENTSLYFTGWIYSLHVCWMKNGAFEPLLPV
jgi:hypothetical protein